MVFSLEFKNGKDVFTAQDAQQAEDYAIDIKNFHKESENLYVCPILIATDAKPYPKKQSDGCYPDTNLIPDILKLVDEGRIALTPAVELSYLNSHEQEVLNEIMDCDEVTPSLSQAQRLRKLSEDYTLTDSGISQIMSEIKGNQKEYLKIEAAPLKRYFPPGTTAKQMQTTMIRAMEFYRQHTQNRADKPKEREER